MSHPLLMIPGPVELSAAVCAAAAEPPLSHTSPPFIARFAGALRAMRTLWRVGLEHQPFIVAGSGTLAMEMAVANTLEPGQRAIVADTGYFSRRMAEILARRSVSVQRVGGRLLEGGMPAVSPQALIEAIERADGPVHAVFITHVDTSTGVRCDVRALAAAVRAVSSEVIIVVDGVCSVGGEVLDQEGWDLDVVLTASQKALSAPPGLALLVASPRVFAARERLTVPPPLLFDLLSWLPVHQSYEKGRPAYFATPATSLVSALHTSLEEIISEGIDLAVARHARSAEAMRRAWSVLGLRLVAEQESCAANTLSALWLPEGVDGTFPAKVAARGVTVAGGLHPELLLKGPYLRVGHLGWVTSQPERLLHTVRAVGDALIDSGTPVDPDAAVAAASAVLNLS